MRIASWNIAVLPDGYYTIVDLALRRLAESGGSFLDILGTFENMLQDLAGSRGRPMTFEDTIRPFWRPEGQGGGETDEQALIEALEQHCRSRRNQRSRRLDHYALLRRP